MRYFLLILCSCLGLSAFATEAMDDDALIAQAEKIVNEEPVALGKAASAKAKAKAADAATEKAVAAKSTATENEADRLGESKGATSEDLPVFLESKKAEATTGSTLVRLGLSLALLAAIAGATIFASKRWPKKGNVGGKGTRIDILHQLHVGPRRNLTLVRVAGEVMLLGMTDHNVNLIKTVTLIDDELETLATQDFNNFLEDEFSVEDVRSVIRTRT